jgi:hypothetical protein
MSILSPFATPPSWLQRIFRGGLDIFAVPRGQRIEGKGLK